jgi:hypothetical protein
VSGEEEWTNQDGPALRAAHRRARQIDDAQTAGERRRAWGRFVPSAVVALVEDALHRWVGIAALLLSVAVALAGATSGEAGLALAGVAVASVGAVVVIVAMVRWSYGRQWAAFLGIIAVQALMIAGLSQAT